MTDKSTDEKVFLCPSNVSKKWIRRFRALDFVFDCNGCLYSPKTWNDEWDNQTKALWLRSVGMSPDTISKKLNVKLTTVKNRWLDNITLHYKLKNILYCDWSTFGYTDTYGNRYISYGGVPKITGRSMEVYVHAEIYNDLSQVREGYKDPDPDPDTDTEPEIDPSEKLYREWYINDND